MSYFPYCNLLYLARIQAVFHDVVSLLSVLEPLQPMCYDKAVDTSVFGSSLSNTILPYVDIGSSRASQSHGGLNTTPILCLLGNNVLLPLGPGQGIEEI